MSRGDHASEGLMALIALGWFVAIAWAAQEVGLLDILTRNP